MKRILFFMMAMMLSIGASMAQDFSVGTWGFSYDGTGGVLAWGTQDQGAVVVPSSVTYSSTTYTVTGIRHDFSGHCPNQANITSIQLPEGIKVIQGAGGAFRDLTHVTTFNIPSTVTSIGPNAFTTMTALTSVYSAMTTPVTIATTGGDRPFYNTPIGSVTLHIPVGTASAYASAGWTGFGSVVDDIGASSTVPGAPTAVSASSGDAQATVSFTAPANNGGATITGYTVTSNPGAITQTGAASPLTVTGLTNGTAYTFTVVATNSVGNSVASAASNSVTPAAAASYTASTNLALGKAITGYPDVNKTDITDGSFTTKYNVSQPSQYYILDFGAAKTISYAVMGSGYTLDGTTTSDAIKGMKLQWSNTNNGSDWADIPGTVIINNPNTNFKAKIHFPAISTRYVKWVLNIWCDGQTMYKPAEIEIYNPVTVSSSISTSSMTLNPENDVLVNAGNLLTIDNSVNINGLIVSAGAQVTNSNNSLTASTLTINSDATGTGTYVESGTGTSTITTANVQQYLPQGRNWYVSSPVTAGNTSSLTASGTAASVSYYNEPMSAWVNNYSGTLTSGKGYIAVSSSGTGTNNVQFSGTLNTGNVAVTLTKQGSTFAGYNLVANPYPSYLNPMAAITANSNLVSTIWYRTRSTGGTPTYYFETVNTASGVGTNVAGTGTVTGYIPPMQAFWLKTNADAQTLTFTNDMRYHANPSSVTTTPLKAKSHIVQPLIRLQVSNGITNDETVIYSNPNAQNGFDAYDSPKRTNANLEIPEIFTTAGTEHLVINGFNNIPLDQEISLGLTAGNSTNLSIKSSEISNIEDGIRMILRDYLDPNHVVEQDLTDGTAYSFTSATSATTTGRFAVIFKSSKISTGIDHNNDLEIKIFRNGNGQVTINCPTEFAGKARLTIYNTVGQSIEKEIIRNSVTVLPNQFKVGVYLVNVMAEGKSWTRKIVIE